MSYSLGAFVSAPFSGGRVEGRVTAVRQSGRVRISRAYLVRTGMPLGTVWRREAQLSPLGSLVPPIVNGQVWTPPQPKAKAIVAPVTTPRRSLGGRILAFAKAVGRSIRRAAASLLS